VSFIRKLLGSSLSRIHARKRNNSNSKQKRFRCTPDGREETSVSRRGGKRVAQWGLIIRAGGPEPYQSGVFQRISKTT